MELDPCVMGDEPCCHCMSLTPEQMLKLAILKHEIYKENKSETSKMDNELVDPQDVSVTKAVSPLKPCPASALVSAIVSTSSDPGKCLNSMQDEWTICFARIEALPTIKSRTGFSLVKAFVSIKYPVASAVPKTPLL